VVGVELRLFDHMAGLVFQMLLHSRPAHSFRAFPLR